MFGAVFKRLSGVRALGLAMIPAMIVVAIAFGPPVAAAADGAIGESADNLLQNGLEALADKQPDEARQFFDRILKVYPRSTAATSAERQLQRLDGGAGDAVIETEPDGDGQDRRPSAREAGAGQQAKLLRRTFVTDVGDRVFFAENSATIGGRARAVIEAEARWLKARPDVRIKIIGRADDGGSAEDGRLLSAKRAEAVRDKLIESGVAAERLVLEARGSQDPVATCRSPMCQAQNRIAETLVGPAGQDFATDGNLRTAGGRKDAAATQPSSNRALAR